MFYWFAQCLTPFFYHGVGLNPTSPFAPLFNILHWVDLEEMYGLFCKKLTQNDRWNWCFKYSREVEISLNKFVSWHKQLVL
jgi:hypothetical protein